MKPEKQLEQLCRYYYLQMRVAEEMRDAYSAHTHEDEYGVLYSLLLCEFSKDALAEFWKKFEPRYSDAIALKNG